ncbi:hypothetical protein GV828_04510 [Flavobacterium sp. NST-5]|uniref:Signal peptidase n=1 Tax=Flavobacterium ichthyis TaxID=2698827 RepID=A0ABW9Z6H7_9FLAO|nr:hypothetical protein [Flavobacterium ichthyis]NBL64461.1 hypothetical protein [Flavobacterium ichthyis]
MKNNIKYRLALMATIFLNIMSAYADESNPSEPPEDVPQASIDSTIWLIILIAVAIGIALTNKPHRGTISKN